MKDRETVAILGAGPGGLAAGYELARQGIAVSVCEKESYVGGLCRTIIRDGYRFDLGGHRWFTKNDVLNTFLIDLMGKELIWVNRISRIYFKGKYFDYPIRIMNVLQNIGPLTSFKAVMDYAIAQLPSRAVPPEQQNMEDAYIKLFGRTLYGMFFKNYSEKVWGRNCRDLSADWVVQRVKGMSILTALRHAIFPQNGGIVSLVDRFMYPRLGYSRISERLAEEITLYGGRVILNHMVSRVHHNEKRIVGINTRDSEGKETYMEADYFLSTIPINLLVRLMDPKPPKAILEAAAQLRFRDLITVNLMIDREQITPDTWLYIHDREIGFARLHEPSNWSPDMAPQGKTSLVAEYFCDEGDRVWTLSDEALCEITVRDLVSRLRFIGSGEVIDGFAVRAKRAYPAYHIGYQRPLETVKGYLRGLYNLQIVGRGGTFRYNNSDHSIEMGFLAAKNILGAKEDLDQVNSLPEYLEVKQIG
jgi:protoporphyrinogen oxidase